MESKQRDDTVPDFNHSQIEKWHITHFVCEFYINEKFDEVVEIFIFEVKFS